MTNIHRADENGMITDLSKVSNSDTVRRGGASWLVRAKNQVWDKPGDADRSEAKGERHSRD